jgi:isocitrate dehydrogenase
MSKQSENIIYTKVDEAPALATYSLLPIIRAYTGDSGIEFETRDISLAGRIVASFPEKLTEAQKQPDDLAYLGELVETPAANIIKLPNISASLPQLTAAIRELQAQGYAIPDYPAEPKNDEERDIKDRYARILGSAVNPVLREGNSDRRVAEAVKNFVRKNPHRMGPWTPDSKTHVAHMPGDDFAANEKSTVLDKKTTARIEFVGKDGSTTMLKDKLPLLEGEVLDSTVMRRRALRAFIEEQIEDAKGRGVLFSVHLKATMMKVSDPILFGHVVSVYFKDVYDKHAALFKDLGIHPNNGLGDLYSRIADLPDDKKAEIEADIEAVYTKRPPLAMVNSDK